jgi:hypothetical protein
VAALLAASMAAAATAAEPAGRRSSRQAGRRVCHAWASVAYLQHAGSQQRKELPQNGHFGGAS